MIGFFSSLPRPFFWRRRPAFRYSSLSGLITAFFKFEVHFFVLIGPHGLLRSFLFFLPTKAVGVPRPFSLRAYDPLFFCVSLHRTSPLRFFPASDSSSLTLLCRRRCPQTWPIPFSSRALRVFFIPLRSYLKSARRALPAHFSLLRTSPLLNSALIDVLTTETADYLAYSADGDLLDPDCGR